MNVPTPTPPLPSPDPRRLPRGVRLAAALCLVLSAFSGLLAVQEAVGLSDLAGLREASTQNGLTFGLDAAVAQRAMEAQLSSLEGMREGRVVTLGALAVACFLAFSASARLLRPGGVPRESMRRLLGFSAVAAAVLRTVDGAQWAVVSRRVGAAMAEGMARLPDVEGSSAAAFLPHLPAVATALAVGWTALVVGTFVLLGHYFQSERVRSALTLADGQASRG